jgi:hypothetical protein
MHAEKLYHRIMDYGGALEEAKRNNQPIPTLSSVCDPDRAAPTIEQFNLPDSVEKEL